MFLHQKKLGLRSDYNWAGLCSGPSAKCPVDQGLQSTMGPFCRALQSAPEVRWHHPFFTPSSFALTYLLPPFPLQKAAFQDANVCLFVFDCIYFNDVSLMDR